MNSRRSFFRRFAGVIAAVAMAPEIAFSAKLALPQTTPDCVAIDNWIESFRGPIYYTETYRRWQELVLEQTPQCRSDDAAKAMVDSMFFGTTIS